MAPHTHLRVSGKSFDHLKIQVQTTAQKRYPRKITPPKPLPTAHSSQLRLDFCEYLNFNISFCHINLHPIRVNTHPLLFDM